jgi:hypothetical protein
VQRAGSWFALLDIGQTTQSAPYKDGPDHEKNKDWFRIYACVTITAAEWASALRPAPAKASLVNMAGIGAQNLGVFIRFITAPGYLKRVPAADLSDLEKRINKWGDCGPLGQHDESAKKDQDDDNRRKPELLSLSHEIPQVFKQFEHQKGFSMLSIDGAFDSTR